MAGLAMAQGASQEIKRVRSNWTFRTEIRKVQSFSLQTACTFIKNLVRENGKTIDVEYAEAFHRIVIDGALVEAE